MLFIYLIRLTNHSFQNAEGQHLSAREMDKIEFNRVQRFILASEINMLKLTIFFSTCQSGSQIHVIGVRINESPKEYLLQGSVEINYYCFLRKFQNFSPGKCGFQHSEEQNKLFLMWRVKGILLQQQVLNISHFSISTLTKPPKITPSYSPITLISIGILACKCTCSNPDNSRNILACSSCQMAELNFGLAKSVEKTVITLHVPWKKVGMVTFVCY